MIKTLFREGNNEVYLNILRVADSSFKSILDMCSIYKGMLIVRILLLIPS